MRFWMLLVAAAASLMLAGPVSVSPALADDENTCFKTSGDEAIAACTRVIQDRGKSAKSHEDAYVNRGVEYNNKGDYDRAIADYNEAIPLDPKDPHARNDRGESYRHKGDYDRAIVDYTEAIRLDPKYAPAHYNRGLAKRAKGDTAGDDADVATAKQLDPKVGN